MLFSSLTFLFGFLPMLLILYFIIPKRKIKNLILLIFSLVFYAWGEPKYIFLMLLTILVVYIFGLLIDKFDKESKNIKKLISLIISIVLIIGNLIFFKYFDFIINNVNYLFKTNISNVNLILPIGISFYTFQILSYIIDLYRKKIKVQKNFFNLSLYVSFFPQLIAGPIVRYETIEDEIENRKENFYDILNGSKRFIIGLSKKVIIANNMALIADSIFNNYGVGYGTSVAWLAAIAYTLQIYFDFSGYSDMAIGLGQIFGFHFLENFNYPYIATSVTDFWRRWHISLSSWFRDYIYIPLGGNKKGIIKQIRNILIVWCLTGLWHGASWNFVLWGLYYAIFLLIEKFLLKDIINKIPKFIRWIITMIIVIIGWVIFRSETLNGIVIFVKDMFIYKSTDWLAILAKDISVYNSFPMLLFAIAFSFPIIKKVRNKYENKVLYTIMLNMALIILLIINVCLLTSSSYNPFIYFRF